MFSFDDLQDLDEHIETHLAYHRYCEDPYCFALHRKVNIFEVKQYIEELVRYREDKLARSVIERIQQGDNTTEVRIFLEEFMNK